MHPKNIFITDYDFDALVFSSPDLAHFVFVNQYGTKTIKFGDKEAVRALNSALLKHHYHINWHIPVQNLCPPIPGRLDYLLHIADLIQKPDIHLLDIGTGANLIYPILACCHLNWTCVASESDYKAYKNAEELIVENEKLNSIHLIHQKNKGAILENIITSKDKFDVVICNPPFFKNAKDAHEKNRRKAKNLKLGDKGSLNFGGMSNELWYKGGEEAFVKKMISESVIFEHQVSWFTALISNKDHLSSIKRFLKKTKPSEIRVVEMTQGNKKSRFVAWTFT